MTPPDLLDPPLSPVASPADSLAPVGPPAPPTDRTTLAVETARQPGGELDPENWVAPTPARVQPFLAGEPDQARIDGFAYSWLQDGARAKATGTGGGIHEEFKAGLQTYVDFRKARGEEPFQYLQTTRSRAEAEEARKQVPFFRTLFSDPEKMAEAFPEEERAAFSERFGNALDPVVEKQKAAGVLLVSTMTGRPAEEVADLWPQYREKYGTEHLGLSGKIDDAVFYQAAGKAFTQEAKDDETARDIAAKSQRFAIQGKPLADVVAMGREATGDKWHRFQPAARNAYAGILAEFSDPEIKSGRALFEALADIKGKNVEDIAKGDGQKAAWVPALEHYGRTDQATRDRIMSLIGLQAQAEGEDIQNYLARLGAAVQSGADMIDVGMGSMSTRTNLPELEAIAAKQTDPAEREHMSKVIDELKGKATFAADLQSAGVKVRRYLDDKREGFWDTAGDWVVMAAESLPIMAASAIPYGAGIPVVMTAYAERDLSTYRRAAPNADEASLTRAAYASGAIEAGIDRLQWLTLGARLPKLNAALMKYGKPGAVAVATARAGVVTGAETGQEVLQDFTPHAVQELASTLDKDIPGPQWGKVLAQEADALGDIAGVSMLFGIIGGAGSTITDYIQAPRLAKALQDREGMALAGFEAATIDEVATLAETNPAAAAQTLQAAMLETPKEVRQANAQEARARLEAENGTADQQPAA